MQEFDYIVVGGGTAGCALAARLTETPSITVLLLEAGPTRSGLLDFWKIDMPGAFDYAYLNPKYNWLYEGEEEPGLHNRRILQPRGKILGGSSAINGMVHLRGHALDFERWQREGAAGWSWPEVLPYFKRLECWEGGESAYRGGSGPVGVSTGKSRCELHDRFLQAGAQAGYPKSDDINGAQQDGFSVSQMAVRNGVRESAANAYIQPVSERPNLTVKAGSTALKLQFQGNRVAGVHFVYGGVVTEARARRETILAAGAVGSPQLLMLSGIGPANHLQDVGIACRANLPGVGQNLQDHPIVYQKFAIKKPVSMNRFMRVDKMARIGARWMLTRKGLGATSSFESLAIIRSEAAVVQPDLLMHFIPALIDDNNKMDAKRNGFCFAVGSARVEATGWVKLRSADPFATPRILSNLLATDHDLSLMRKSIEISRELARQKSFRDLGVEEVATTRSAMTRRELDHHLRSTVAGDYHLSCTCRIGSDERAVVDSELKVHGVDSLRVVDASVMPSIVSANTNATTFMIAEKAADLILGRAPVAAASV